MIEDERFSWNRCINSLVKLRRYIFNLSNKSFPCSQTFSCRYISSVWNFWRRKPLTKNYHQLATSNNPHTPYHLRSNWWALGIALVCFCFYYTATMLLLSAVLLQCRWQTPPRSEVLLSLSARLDWAFWASMFEKITFPSSSSFFFFWFQPHYLTKSTLNNARVHYLWISQILLFSHFFIKNGSHSTIHILKNYFATVFSVSIFSFNKNKLNPNGP